MSDISPRLPVTGNAVVGFFGRLIKRLVRKRGFWIVALVLFVVWVAPSACTTNVPPNMVGVHEVNFGERKGIRDETYGPGTHFMAAGIERLHLMPTDLQLVNFSDSKSEMSAQARTAPSIKIQTNDGYNVQLDVTVLYRLKEPARVLKESGSERAFEDRLVIPRADRILRKSLGELNSEEFYQGPRRIEKSTLAHDELAKELKPFGIEVEAVLVRGYAYDARYQQLIEGRKIKDQTVFLRQAEAKSAIEQRKRDTAVAEGRATADVELSRGRAEVQKLGSTADLYRRTKAAEGKLLVELAEAKGTQLENTALQGAGSENMVGIKMADVLKGVRALVLSSDGKDGTNPLDLQTTLRKFEVK